jgi:EAL domain-containing protein (putative c-di-GMP-specific phosphodiesterase class I)
MEVVAEGIELEQQLDFLKKEGCDEGQGYLIAKPLPHDDFVAFLKLHANGLSGFLPPGASTQHQLYGHG